MNDPRCLTGFFRQDVLEVAPRLLGKYLVTVQPGGGVARYVISETEAYRGTDDRACHASKGRTLRTQVMFEHGGLLYMYLIYGMYWMLNIVTGEAGNPQAVLIRGLREVSGPGRLTRELGIDGSFYGEDLASSPRIWIEHHIKEPRYHALPRVGIDYAGEPWKSIPWRFLLAQEDN